MAKIDRLADLESTQRTELMARVSALLNKTPPDQSISTAAKAAAYKVASKRASAAAAKPKASLRSLREAERDLNVFHQLNGK